VEEHQIVAIVAQQARRIGAAALAAMLAVSACNPTPTPSPSPAPATQPPAPTPSGDPRVGGTLYLLTDRRLEHLDPQRIYDPEDLAFLGSTVFRSLLSYRSSPDAIEGTTLVPDLATDLGRPSDGGRTWEFTLRDGVIFETGEPITCQDIRYGISRTFATDVITGGPRYAIQFLDIPPNPVTDAADPRSAFPSAYYGPYEGTGQSLFDQAVECSPDNRTITFHLSTPVADFNYVTTLGFSPVPIGRDTREQYGLRNQFPSSSGPYIVLSNTPADDDVGGELVLVRNPNWDPENDPVRPAYPDRWVIEYGLDPNDVDARLIAADGDDAFALGYGQLQGAIRPDVFESATTPKSQFADRAVSGVSPFVHYIWIDAQRVPNLQERQAIMVAINRTALLNFQGGAFHGGYADGLISPSIGEDYAPTGIWETGFDQPIPEAGAPALARELIRDSGENARTFVFATEDTHNGRTFAEAVRTSLERAGIRVRVRVTPGGEGDFGAFGWAADWPSASSVIPPLLTLRGGWDRSNVDDPAFNEAIAEALATLDPEDQARMWQDLNRQAVENAWVVPTFYTRSYALAGTKVGPIYRWPAYSSWPYADLHVVR
jgi:peptide/nickel transport system substrate-binding protein